MFSSFVLCVISSHNAKPEEHDAFAQNSDKKFRNMMNPKIVFNYSLLEKLIDPNYEDEFVCTQKSIGNMIKWGNVSETRCTKSAILRQPQIDIIKATLENVRKVLQRRLVPKREKSRMVINPIYGILNIESFEAPGCDFYLTIIPRIFDNNNKTSLVDFVISNETYKSIQGYFAINVKNIPKDVENSRNTTKNFFKSYLYEFNLAVKRNAIYKSQIKNTNKIKGRLSKHGQKLQNDEQVDFLKDNSTGSEGSIQDVKRNIQVYNEEKTPDDVDQENTQVINEAFGGINGYYFYILIVLLAIFFIAVLVNIISMLCKCCKRSKKKRN